MSVFFSVNFYSISSVCHAFFIISIKSRRTEQRTRELSFIPHSVRFMCATRSCMWPRHRSLRMSSLDLRRALWPMHAWCVGSGAARWLQILRVYSGCHTNPVRPSRPVSVQNRLRRTQVREMCQGLLRISTVSTLRLQYRWYNTVPRWCLRMQRRRTVSLQGELEQNSLV